MAKVAVYLAVLVAVAVIVESNGQKKSHDCPANKVWSECPSKCPPECGKDRPGESFGCIAVCDEPNRCVCKDGYLKSGDNCVLSKDCPKRGNE